MQEFEETSFSRAVTEWDGLESRIISVVPRVYDIPSLLRSVIKLCKLGRLDDRFKVLSGSGRQLHDLAACRNMEEVVVRSGRNQS